MDADSFYLAMSGDILNDIVKPEMKEAYGADKKISERTPGLFKLEFVGTRGVWLTAKCYLYTAVKVFQRSIMICIFSAIKMS